MKTKTAGWFTLFLAMMLAVAGCGLHQNSTKTGTEPKTAQQTNTGPGENRQTAGKQIAVKLAGVTDGDTIKIYYHGKEETVRYLLVDTPESKKPDMCVQPYAKAAYYRNKQLVSSGKLTIEFDHGAKRDKYGRLLAYVFVNGKSVQEKLLKEGYARVAYVYEPPYQYLGTFKKAEQRAKNEKLRVWSQPGYATDRGFNGCEKGSSASSATGGESRSSSGSSGFQNCTELRKQYPDGVPHTNPAYRSYMDGDKDGYACEPYK
ncbi:thermonuclease family protein [Heyndrickxia coagulans]|uniref:thermonuclease family protein n=1 Tax=Heyndrickxia coagulans TaxID=1398 RepID=UPI001F48C3CE|nr:thermonuclease family protein [Heyndrickxia coagulans]UJZ86712.1 thermonuclease family protein [Heyndrickxia coagulans]